ncbi:MAG: hypothetical protein FJX74_06745 [Armatimonadetes bacterium]|nr:hypothetical protein [Armatimonadota bacterium]
MDELLTARWLREQDGLLHGALPWVPWREDSEGERLRALAERVIEPMADAAEELRVLAAQSTFARCRFADAAHLLTSIATGYVVENLRRSGLIAAYPNPIPPGWGAWLYLPEG